VTTIDPNIEKTLAAAYDPLKDPASDGFVDVSKQAWKAGASGLDAANAAPLAPGSDRSNLKKWLLIIALICAFAAGWSFYSNYQAHKKTVEAIQSPPSGSPEIGVSTINKKQPTKTDKSAPKNGAKESTSTPASGGFYGLKHSEKSPEKPRIKDDFNAEFDKEQARFEANLKKEFP
jgi:hypothetical protein